MVANMPPDAAATLAARILNLAVYLPALALVLFRPNESESGFRDTDTLTVAGFDQDPNA
jgi:hypothetical protein